MFSSTEGGKNRGEGLAFPYFLREEKKNGGREKKKLLAFGNKGSSGVAGKGPSEKKNEERGGVDAVVFLDLY